MVLILHRRRNPELVPTPRGPRDLYNKPQSAEALAAADRGDHRCPDLGVINRQDPAGGNSVLPPAGSPHTKEEGDVGIVTWHR